MDLHYYVRITTADQDEPAAIDSEDVKSAIKSELGRALSPEVAEAVHVEPVDVYEHTIVSKGHPARDAQPLDELGETADEADVAPPA